MTWEISTGAKPLAADRRFVLTVAATSLAFLLVQLDVTIVNVALATMGEALHAPLSGLQWVVDAYAIAFASLLLSAGALGDRMGPRRILTLGFAVFIAASAGCGLAPSGAILIAARVAQGVGAALMVPASLALLNHASGGDARLRGHAVAWWTAAGSVGLAAGPLAGGLLIAAFGWRSIFFVNAPLGLLSIWLTLTFVEEATPGGERRSFDIKGQSFAIIGLPALTAGVIEAGAHGVGEPLALLLFALAVAAGAAFLFVEARSADPMLPLGLFRSLKVSAMMGVGLVVNFALYGFLFVLGLYFQRAHGLSAQETGFAFLPLSVVVGLANVAAGWLMAKIGARTLMIAGLGVGAVGFALIVGIEAQTSYLALAPGFLLISGGVGAAVPAMTTTLLAAVDKSQAGVASGALNMIRQAAGAVGVALFGAIGGDAAQSMTGLRATFWLAAAVLAAGAAMAAVGGGRGATRA